MSLRGSIYRGSARLLHRFDFHHTRRIGPLAPDGVIVHRCEWCGVSRTEVPLEVTLRRMKAEHSAALNHRDSPEENR